MEGFKMKKRQLEVYLARTEAEIDSALSLRYEIFNQELNEGLYESSSNQKDRDAYDEHCEHLIVVDKDKDDKVVGTYRLLQGKSAAGGIGFYSETEFNLTSLYSLSDNIMEIGRSCVHRDYRDGSVISMLWQGLADCIIQYNIRYLMGCASLHTTDGKKVSEIYAYLREKDFLAEECFHVEPRQGFILEDFDPDYRIQNLKETAKRIPTIIKGYMRVGAKICGLPALDSSFGTVDVFVLFDAEKISARYNKKFLNKKIISESI